MGKEAAPSSSILKKNKPHQTADNNKRLFSTIITENQQLAISGLKKAKIMLKKSKKPKKGLNSFSNIFRIQKHQQNKE